MAEEGLPIDPLEGLPTPGDVIDGAYRVEAVLGVGGTGVVFRALRLDRSERVAIKTLTAESARRPVTVQRFQREAKTASLIENEHVARISHVGELENGLPYMVMELLQGEDLEASIEAGSTPLSQAVDLVLQVAEALAEAHTRGIIHRDIKPSNIFVTRRADGTPRAKVLDFGISKVVQDGHLTKTQTLLGSPLYMSPEQLSSTKGVDHRTDIWSLGVVLYELVSGELPFEGETLPEICTRVLHSPMRPLQQVLPQVDPRLDAVISRSLTKNRETRFQNVAELAEALSPFGSPRARASAETIFAYLDYDPHARRQQRPRLPSLHYADDAEDDQTEIMQEGAVEQLVAAAQPGEQAPSRPAGMEKSEVAHEAGAASEPPPSSAAPTQLYVRHAAKTEQAPLAEPEPVAAKAVRSRRWLLVLGVIVVALLAVVAALILTRAPSDEPPADAVSPAP